MYRGRNAYALVYRYCGICSCVQQPFVDSDVELGEAPAVRSCINMYVFKVVCSHYIGTCSHVAALRRQ